MRRRFSPLLLLVSLIFSAGRLCAQSDGLKVIFKEAESVKKKYPETAFRLYDSALTICKEKADFYSMAHVYVHIARHSLKNNQPERALSNLLNAKALAQTYSDSMLNYSVVHEMVLCDFDLFKYKIALVNANKGLELASRIDNDSIKIYSKFNWICSYYFFYGTDSAQSVYRALKEIEVLNNKADYAYFKPMINSFYCMFYSGSKEYDKAIAYNELALKDYRKMNDSLKISSCYRHMGNIYFDQNKYDKAFEYYELAYKFAYESQNYYNAASSATDVAYLYGLKKDLKNLEKYASIAEKICDETITGSDDNYTFTWLGEIYERIGDTKRSLYYFKKLNETKDNVLMNNRADELMRLESELTHNHDLSVQQKEFDRQEQIKEGERLYQKKLKNFALIGLVITAFFLFFVYRSYIRKKKDNILITRQKEEVQLQKKLIEEQNREINDSISYAKRLQEGILPANDYVKKHIEDSFILYKPKNIVAGDFYWIEQKNDWTYVAAADCTGHGVPGAMVSVICCNALNRSVNSFKKILPGEILDKTRDLVLKTFTKSAAEIKDGMDISLLALNKNTLEVMWSGANNPLWYVSDGELIEIKADKQPVGFNDHAKPFTTRHLKLKKGDVVYLFTDGYADQFGGAKGKKFKSSQLKEVLLNVQSKSVAEQSEILSNKFIEWKGHLEQIDDVLIIGIRV